MNKKYIPYILIFFISFTFTEEKKNQFIMDDLGISIDVPIGKSKSSFPSQTIAMFFLPVENDFAGNVNIIKQAYQASIDDFVKLTDTQLKAAQFKVHKKEIDKNIVIYEYSGNAQGKKLHWYAKAIKKGEFVYLATATSLEDSWEKQRETLVKSVMSFQIHKDKDKTKDKSSEIK